MSMWRCRILHILGKFWWVENISYYIYKPYHISLVNDILFTQLNMILYLSMKQSKTLDQEKNAAIKTAEQVEPRKKHLEL